jgi:predicted phosphate transport protein (TIGR00153 family)
LNEKGLSAWFVRRRESIAARHIREHVTKVIDTAVDLDNALAAALDNHRVAVLDALKTVYMDEKAADNMEVTLFEDLSKGELDAKQREGLMRLVRRIDDVSDYVKQAALNLEILLEWKRTVPREFWYLYKEMSKSLVDQTRALRAAVEAFGRDDEEVLRHGEEVRRLENVIDSTYFELLKKLIRSAPDPRAMVVLSDLLGAIETASDRAKDAADMLFILVMANR